MNLSEVVRAWLNAPTLEEIKKVRSQMSELSDKIGAVSTGLSGVSAKLATLGTDLTAEIAEINAKLATGAVTPEDLANLNTIATGLGSVASGLQSLSDQVKVIIP